MLQDFIYQTTNSPGTAATVNLIAPPSGRSAFSARFASGSKVYYFMTDGTQWEAGWGTSTSGSPDTISRDTVLSNSANTTSRLNFAGTGVSIYNEVPGSALVYKDYLGVVNIASTVAATNLKLTNSTGIGANLLLSGNGTTTPNKSIRAFNGQFQIVNDAYSSAILSLDDSGNLSIPGGLTIGGNSGSFALNASANGYQRLGALGILQWGVGTATTAGLNVAWPIAFPNAQLGCSIAPAGATTVYVTNLSKTAATFTSVGASCNFAYMVFGY